MVGTDAAVIAGAAKLRLKVNKIFKFKMCSRLKFFKDKVQKTI